MKTLSPHELTVRLVAEGLLNPADVVEGVRLSDVSRRNRNFAVTAIRGAALLTKQPRPGESTLGREPDLYAAMARHPKRAAVRHVPRLRVYDRRHELLVLEFIRDATSVRSQAERTGRLRCDAAKAIAGAIAAVHQSQDGFDQAAVPSVLSLSHPNVAILREISSGQLQVVAMVQESRAFCRALDRLGESWSATTFIHGDLRWDNCLLSRPARGRWRATLIDWEFGGRGDPAWDLGCFFADFISAWVLSMRFRPQSRTAPLESRLPLESFHAAIAAFWLEYRRLVDVPPPLEKIVQFAAARLAQTSFERTAEQTAVSKDVVCLVQVAVNVMARPREAAATLLGLRAGDEGE